VKTLGAHPLVLVLTLGLVFTLGSRARVVVVIVFRVAVDS
jgi:hypothetical protein